MKNKCPKCGFVQPKDQFCANCGIDMSIYTPEIPSIAWRTIKHPLTQGLAIFILLTGVTAIYYSHELRNVTRVLLGAHQFKVESVLESSEKKQAENIKRIDAQRIKTLTKSAVLPPTRTIPDKIDVENGSRSLAGAESNRLSENQGEVTLASSSAAASPPPPSSPTKGATTEAPSVPSSNVGVLEGLDIDFFEVGHAQIARLQSEGRLIASTDESVSGTFKKNLLNLSNPPEAGELIRRLEPTSSHSLNADKDAVLAPLVVFSGVLDPVVNDTIGVTAQLLPQRTDEDGNLVVDVNVLVKMRDQSSTSAGVAVKEQRQRLTINAKSAGFLSISFPRRVSYDESEQRLLSSSVLKVLNSAEFQSGSSELILFISPRNARAGPIAGGAPSSGTTTGNSSGSSPGVIQ